MLSARIPIKLSVRVSAKQKFGFRFFGKCKNYGSDSFVFRGDVSTVANIALGFYLNSSISVIPSGDYVLTLKPSAVMMFNIEDTDVDFHISGVSPVSGIWTSVVSSGTAVFSALDALFDGKSVMKDLENSFVLSTAAPIVLGVGALPKDLETSLWNLLLDRKVREAEKKSSHFGNDFEERINEGIKKGLGIDSTGIKRYIINKDVVQLLELGKSIDDVVKEFPVDPSKVCLEKYVRDCRGWWCSKFFTYCNRQGEEFRKKYSQSDFRYALPQIAT